MEPDTKPTIVLVHGAFADASGWSEVIQTSAIPPVAERAMAARARAVTVEIDSSHVAFISHPQEAVDLILAAVRGS